MDTVLINKLTDEFIAKSNMPKRRWKIKVLKKAIANYLKYAEFDENWFYDVLQDYDELLNT